MCNLSYWNNLGLRILQSFVYFQFACALIERTKRYDVYLKTSKRYISYSCSSERKRKGRKKERRSKKENRAQLLLYNVNSKKHF